MSFTKNANLPEESELTVQELDVTYAHLKAASVYIGKRCEFENNEFLLCKKETEDPRKCLNEGKAVTACAIKLFQDIKKHCAQEFTQYAKCLDFSSSRLEFDCCRKTQAVFDKCMLDKLNLERPPFGYFCEARVHDSARPRAGKPFSPPYSDRLPELPKAPPEDRNVTHAPITVVL